MELLWIRGVRGVAARVGLTFGEGLLRWETMSKFGIRPCFSHYLGESPEAAVKRIGAALEASDGGFEVKVFPGFVCLRVPPGDRHFWSPRLNLSFHQEGEGTRVNGVYGPNANVWSLFLYGYLLGGSVAVFSGCFGFAQWSLGTRAWGLWICGLALVVLAGLYVGAQLGQKLGAQQQFRLHQAYEEVSGGRVEI